VIQVAARGSAVALKNSAAFHLLAPKKCTTGQQTPGEDGGLQSRLAWSKRETLPPK
jgi:hypothetical protein